MSKRKRQKKKKLTGKGRLNNAKKWLQSRTELNNLIETYSKRYSVSNAEAWDELITIGYYDDILIQQYEKEGIKWEYKVQPLSGEMYVVPEGTEEYMLYV